MAVLACLLAGAMFPPAAQAGAFTDEFAAAAATTITVNSTGDAVDASAGNGVCETAAGNGVCTLRAAIQESNANAGTDTIAFNIGGGGAVTIAVASGMPTTTDPVVIDGTTQPGWSGAPIVQLTGGGPSGSGLKISGGSSTVRGLVINRFNQAIELDSANNRVEGCYIGTDPTGTTVTGYGNSDFGVVIAGLTTNGGNTIGGPSPAQRNVIAGSAGISRGGVTILTSDNVVQGNYIGTNAAGTAGLGGQYYGIDIRQGFRNVIGGSGAGEGNLIAGHTSGGGVKIGPLGTPTGNTGNNRVRGNRIGLNAAGTAALPDQVGVWIFNSNSDAIGGTAQGEGNAIVSSNTGIDLDPNLTQVGTTIQGNRVGTDATGSTALQTNTALLVGDKATSVLVGGTSSTTPNGPCTGACNVLSGSFQAILRGSGNTIQGNFLGVNQAGTGSLVSNTNGVFVSGSQNTIGGTSVAARNVSMGFHSIHGGSGNVFQGNYVGIKSDGSAALAGSGAGLQGVSVSGANTVGGTAGITPGGPCTGACNVISAGNIGVMTGATATVQGNFIGTTPDGTAAIPNGTGVWVQGSDALIGGTTAAERNVISGNTGSAVLLQPGSGGAAPVRNKIRGNYIGTTADGSAALPNATGNLLIPAAVFLTGNTADSDIGGSAGAGNLIAHNGGYGVYLDSNVGAGNRITHNSLRANSRIGIDINPEGSSPNDAGDADTGPNDRQNFPVLTSAVVSPAQTDVEGTLNSEPSKTYTIDFYASRECDASGFGEGDSHLGSTSVTTDANGDASFTVTLAAPPSPDQQRITATATGSGGSTSEFSRCVTRSYARPNAAPSVKASLVPAYTACTAANRVHGPPLEHPSCAPPAQRSATLTVGTSDANGQASAMTGTVRYTVVVGNPSTPADEADVKLVASLSDVRRRSNLSDYTGELQARTSLRITDKANGATALEDGTVDDITHSWTIPCAPTGGAAGATCAATTTADALVPGTVREGRRAIWQLGQTEIHDGGVDEDADTAPNTVFAVQGVFVP
jgi:CSLREA domain-containing protein